jgi:hypothetical protein
VKSVEIAIAKLGAQMFGTLDIDTELVAGVRLSVGVRNSVDKSFSASLGLGTRTLVCSNLLFTGELTVTRKHTAHCEKDFRMETVEAVRTLRDREGSSRERVQTLVGKSLSEEQASHAMLRGYEKGCIGARMLSPLIKEWREPRWNDFHARNAWNLLQCFTEMQKSRQKTQPVQAAAEAIAFQNLVLSL